MGRRTRLLVPARRPIPNPVTAVKVSPLVLRRAIELAAGDMARIELLKDGSALVHNHPRIRSARKAK